MSAHNRPGAEPPLDLSRWRILPNILIGLGGLLAIGGAIANPQQFGYSWLFAYMFFLSFSLGALFLASTSVALLVVCFAIARAYHWHTNYAAVRVCLQAGVIAALAGLVLSLLGRPRLILSAAVASLGAFMLWYGLTQP